MLTRPVRKLEKVLDHETIFLQHYSWLMERATRLTHGARPEAEDLVQDLYVRFVLSKSEVDTSDEERLKGFLFRALQNLQIDRHRTRGTDPLTSHETVDYDSMESALAAVDRSKLPYIRSELAGICEYACIRRKTSRAGSVLILRFFLGYYPSEIVALLKTTAVAVHKLIETARIETKAYLTRPESLHFIGQGTQPKPTFSKRFLPDDPAVLFAELRSRIFASPEGECFLAEDISNIYADGAGEQLTTQQVAHLVSCRKCLERANDLLNFPNLSKRFPDDPNNLGGGSSGRLSAPIVTRRTDPAEGMRRKLQSTLEHRPKSLEIAIDGQVRGAQKVTSAVSDFRVVLKPTAHPKFISVLSDHGHSLLYLDLENHPLDDLSPNETEVTLSDGRSLQLTISTDGASPVIYVSYYDPLLGSADQSWAFNGELQSTTRLEPRLEPGLRHDNRQIDGFRQKLSKLLSILGARWPLGVTVALSLAALFSVLILHYFHKQSEAIVTESAPTLLAKSERETRAAIPLGGAVKQTFSIEVHGGEGRLIASGTVETLHSTTPERRATRLFGSTHGLLAGRWEDSQGKLTTYSPKAGLLRKPNNQSEVLSAEQAWVHIPDANDFQQFAAQPTDLELHTEGDTYEVSYRRANTSTAASIVYADLVLLKGSLRPIAETIRFREGRGQEAREYRYRELNYETVPSSMVSDRDFEPDPSLADRTDLGTFPGSARTSAAHLTLSALEVLNNLGPDVEQMINLERQSDGTVELNGVFPTSEQKASVLKVFLLLHGGNQLKLDLHSSDEAMRHRNSIVRHLRN